jgi:amino acid transporter
MQAGLVAAAAALWFLVPSLFLNSLGLCRKGRARLLIALIFIGILAYLMSFGLWLLAAQGSPFRDRVPAPGLIYAFSGFAVLFLYAFVLPGRAFDYVERPEKLPPAALWDAPVRAQPSRRFGNVLQPVGILILAIYWGVGLFGLYRATWLPDPTLLDWVTAHWVVLAGTVALLTLVLFYGSGIGRTTTPRRKGGRRIMLGLATIALSATLLSPALTRGLPWVASFLIAKGPGGVDVVVVDPIGERRRSACDRAATIAAPDRRDLPFTLCGIPDAIWSGLKPGDTLRLSGIRTDFGLRYTAITMP